MLSLVPVCGADPDGLEVIRKLFSEYAHELADGFCLQGFAEELASLPGQYAAPTGALFLLIKDASPIGCGALRPLEPGVAELKRIYVRPEHRGHGHGRALTEHLLTIAANLGYHSVKLDTLRRLTSAVAMYQSLGFAETDPYNDNSQPDIAYFKLRLKP